MKHLLPTLILTLFLAACVDTTGLSAESKRPPKGNPDGAVIVMEFADFQCPACKAAHTQILQPLLEKYGSQIRYEFHHFPIRTLHRYALDAAQAAECAADQGKFWEFTDIDFAKQKEMSREAIKTWVQEAGVADMALWQRCVDSEIKRDTILADYDDGKGKGVVGTPTFFVNGTKVDSDLAKISSAIDAVLRGTMQRL